MDLVQQGTLTQPRTAETSSPRFALIAGAIAAIVVVALVIALAISVLSPTASTNGGLGSDAWRAFRADEQRTAVGGEPLAQQSVVDFRNSEHAESR